MDVEVTESAAGSFDETKQEKYPHLLSRLADYAGGVRRFEVPDEMTSWQVCIVSNKLHWISFNFFFFLHENNFLQKFYQDHEKYYYNLSLTIAY